MFEKLEKRLILKGTIETLTPLHIGSGKSELDIEEADLPVLKDVNDQPYIPGSTLKGRTRVEAERILRKEGYPVCNPPDVKSMCGSTASEPGKFCLACRIFGTAGKNYSVASKVKFRDAYPLSKVEQLIQRSGIAIDRQTGAVSSRALYSVEAVPAGVKFGFELVAENLTDEELRVLWAALRSVEHSAIGGGSSRGFGKMKINIDTVIERSAKYYLGQEEEKVYAGDALEKWFAEKGCL
ncbi:MAG: CRISPR-associated RAMP protein Csx7 [Candidatus Bathyarchaeota archaeon]|nr:CRISPR-associated RAMP protein Csx7 [Candidatus Bathyarchaeota archaeon]